MLAAMLHRICKVFENRAIHASPTRAGAITSTDKIAQAAFQSLQFLKTVAYFLQVDECNVAHFRTVFVLADRQTSQKSNSIYRESEIAAALYENNTGYVILDINALPAI